MPIEKKQVKQKCQEHTAEVVTIYQGHALNLAWYLIDVTKMSSNTACGSAAGCIANTKLRTAL